MSFDPGSLMLSLVISAVGFVAFSYGRKMQRFPQLVVGVALMVFPYFVPGLIWMLVGAVAIGVGLLLALNAGW